LVTGRESGFYKALPQQFPEIHFLTSGPTGGNSKNWTIDQKLKATVIEAVM